MPDLRGRTALVTGAAAGIGAAVARMLAEAGAQTLLADMDAEGLERTRATIEPAQAAACRTDVADPASMQAAVDAALSRWGGLDIAVLNAGIGGAVSPILDYPLDQFDRVLAVNLRGVFLGIRSAAPAIAARGGGAIVIMSSAAGVQGTPGFSAYTASKHGVIGLMRCAALELAPRKIRVNCVSPASIDTGMMRAVEDAFAPGKADGARDAIAAALPLKRYGTPEEVARLAVFLASDAAAFCTGGVYPVDGGMTTGRALE